MKVDIKYYYTLYSNPVRYINQFVLNQAKPEDLLVISSSVQPNTSLTSVEKSLLKPYLKRVWYISFKEYN